jgi:hypothetical protein
MNDIAKVLSHAANSAVVQMPGRRFPGVVIQGDTLSGMVTGMCAARLLAERGDLSELKEVLKLTQKELEDRQRHYEQVLESAGIELPYPKA